MKKPATRHTILWADDDADDLLVMREVLEIIDANHQIIEADNGRKVLEYLYANKENKNFPCLIVLDINMPVMNGKETLALIKKDPVLQLLPVVVLTTSSSPEDLKFCQRYGVEMITKPLTFTGMKEVVVKLLNMCTPSVHHHARA